MHRVATELLAVPTGGAKAATTGSLEPIQVRITPPRRCRGKLPLSLATPLPRDRLTEVSVRQISS